jgi:signal transduction histidine kinase
VSRYLSRAVATFVALVLVAFIVPIALLSSRLAQAELQERADRHAAALAAVVSGFGIEQVDDTTLAAQARVGERALLTDPTGRVVADSAPDEPRPALPDFAAVLRGNPMSAATESGVVAAAPVPGAGEAVNGAAVVVLTADAANARARGVGLTLLVIGIAVVLAAWAFGALLARSLVRPVEQLDDQAAALAAGDLSARVDVMERPAELRRLAVTFNDMATRLQALVQLQRAFVSDAAHQLRTPLTALRLRLEALEDQVPNDADVTVALREAGRLRRLVEELLTLTRLEHAAPGTIAVDLGAVIAERCELWTALAEERGVRVRGRTTGEGPLARAVPGAVEQVLDNYLDNALRVAPPESDIVITTGSQGGFVELRVADCGPGLTPDQRARAFDRFWRGPDPTGGGGTGLGLAIVARLVEIGGGQVHLDARHGGGTVAVATFPAVDEPPPT